MNVRNRNLGDPIRVRASELVPAPDNWRFHPEPQRAALAAVLREVGWLGHLLAWRRPDGKLQLIDGHLRTEELRAAGDQEVSVQLVDLDQREAGLALATHDYLATLIEVDVPAMETLHDSLSATTLELQAVLDEWSKSVPAPAAIPDVEAPAEPGQFRILIECASEQAQRDLLEEFGSRGLACRAIVT